jgi:hypothetical protein
MKIFVSSVTSSCAHGDITCFITASTFVPEQVNFGSKNIFYQTGRTIHGFEALVVLHSMECKCSFLKCNSHVIFIWNNTLEKCGYFSVAAVGNLSILCLLVATCSLTEVLPPLATVNEV